MTKIKENLVWLILIVTIPLVSSIYPLLNSNTRGAQNLVTDLDRAVPFVKEFIIPYMLWYPFIILCLVYFCFKDKKVYLSSIISLASGTIISYVIYYVFQTHVPRPVLTGNDIFTKLVAFIYSTDKPFNCFPSLHVLNSYIMIKGASSCANKNKKASILISFMSILIIISTQLIKQHVILDAVAAVVLGELTFDTAFYFNREKVLAMINKFHLVTAPKKEFEV